MNTQNSNIRKDMISSEIKMGTFIVATRDLLGGVDVEENKEFRKKLLAAMRARRAHVMGE